MTAVTPPVGRHLEQKRRSSAAENEGRLAGVLDLAWSQEGRASIDAAGWSMFPTSLPGGRLTVAPRPTSLRLGLVVVFAHGRQLVAHRLVAREEAAWLTKGDGVVACDPPRKDAEILGLVERAHLGRLSWRTPANARCARLSLRLGRACEGRLGWLPPALRRAAYVVIAAPVLLLAMLSWPTGESETSSR